MRVSPATACLIAALVLAGCEQPLSPAASVVEGTLSAAFSAGEVPFRGRLEGPVTVTLFPQGTALVVIEASGNATQLGRFSLSGPHTVDLATRIGTGTFTFTASNGDLLYATFEGQASGAPPVISIVEVATITGGTGRFAGATGSFTVRRSFDQAAGWTTGTVEGTISSPGVSRQ
jgi:hypothetical protein